MLIVTDENLAEDLLHGRFDSHIVLYQIEGKLGPAIGVSHDFIDFSTVKSAETELLQGHEIDPLAESLSEQIFGDLLLRNDDVLKLLTSSLLKTHTVPIRLVHCEEGGELAKDLRSIETIVGIVILERDEVSDVLEPLIAELLPQVAIDVCNSC